MFSDFPLFPNQDYNNIKKNSKHSGIYGNKPKGELLVQRRHLNGKGCFEVDINIGIWIGPSGKGKLSVVDNESIVEVLNFVYFQSRHLISPWYFVSSDKSVIICQKWTWKQIRLIPNGIVVTINVIFRHVVKKVKIITTGPIIVVYVVLNVHIWWNQVCVLLFQPYLKNIRVILFHQYVLLFVY